MADKRSALIKLLEYRRAGTVDAFLSTDQVGEGLTIEDATNYPGMADGTVEKAGSAKSISIPIHDPSLFANLNTWMLDCEKLELRFTTWDGPDNTVTFDNIPFTVMPLESGDVGQLEGLTITGFIYGLSDADYLTLSEAL